MLKTNCGESDESNIQVTGHLFSIDDLSKSRTVPVKGNSSSRAWRQNCQRFSCDGNEPTNRRRFGSLVTMVRKGRLVDLRSQSCTLCCCVAEHMVETRSAGTNCSTLSRCCLQRNREYLLEKQANCRFLSDHLTGSDEKHVILKALSRVIPPTAAKGFRSLRPEQTPHILPKSDIN